MDFSGRHLFLSELLEIDWDFTGQSSGEGLSRFHWHPARFLPQLPAIMVGALSKPGDRVLDPFCGSGTTLVEARLQGRRSFGIDTNPIATMMASAKVAPFDPDSFDAYRSMALTDIATALGTIGGQLSAIAEYIPQLDEQVRWYHERTLVELAVIWRQIHLMEGAYLLAATAAFSSILKEVCSQDKHWGWICDNVAPKKLVYHDAIASFDRKLRDYRVASASSMLRSGPLPSSRVETGQCADVLQLEPSSSCDLVVTSPPYFGVTDYAKAQRLSFLWLELSLEEIRLSEAGARSKRRRQRALTEFLEDMESSFTQISRVLKPQGYCAIVLGESPAREAHLDEFERIIVACGLRVEERVHRRLPSQRGKIATLKEERILVCRK
jgi:DNA modification methylase